MDKYFEKIANDAFNDELQKIAFKGNPDLAYDRYNVDGTGAVVSATKYNRGTDGQWSVSANITTPGSGRRNAVLLSSDSKPSSLSNPDKISKANR